MGRLAVSLVFLGLVASASPAIAQDEPPPDYDYTPPSRPVARPTYDMPPAQRAHYRKKAATPVEPVKATAGSARPSPEQIEKGFGIVLWHMSNHRESTAIEEAFKYAELGNVKVMALLAEYHEKGQGVPRDLAKAAHWHRKAAEGDHYTSMLALGRMYRKGEGVRADKAESEKWLRRCIESANRGGATFVIEDAQKELQMVRPPPPPTAAATPDPNSEAGKLAEWNRKMAEARAKLPPLPKAPPVATPKYTCRFKIGEQFADGYVQFELVAFNGENGEMTFIRRQSRTEWLMKGYDVMYVTMKESSSDFAKLRRSGFGGPFCQKCGGQGYSRYEVQKQGGFLAIPGRPDVVGWKTEGGTELTLCESCMGDGIAY